MMRSFKRAKTLRKPRKIGLKILKIPGSLTLNNMMMEKLIKILKWFLNMPKVSIGKMRTGAKTMNIWRKDRTVPKRKMLRLNGAKLWNLPFKTLRSSRSTKTTVYTGITKVKESILKMTWAKKLIIGIIYLTRKKKRSLKPSLVPWFSSVLSVPALGVYGAVVCALLLAVASKTAKRERHARERLEMRQTNHTRDFKGLNKTSKGSCKMAVKSWWMDRTSHLWLSDSNNNIHLHRFGDHPQRKIKGKTLRRLPMRILLQATTVLSTTIMTILSALI